MDKSPIHIAFCVNNDYVPYITVTIKSILENNTSNKIEIHILTDGISFKHRKLLNESIRNYTYAYLQIHIVNDRLLRGLKDTWSIYTWYRVLLPQILPAEIHRILYLDADTLVVGDLKEFYALDMTGKAIAGTIDPESFNPATFLRCGYEPDKKYICAGVLFMNLDYWRTHELTEKIVAWGRKNHDKIKYPDQDTINYLCKDSKIILPLRYGIIGSFFLKDSFFQEPYLQELRGCIENPVIIHYAGQAPWIKELSTHLMQKEWERYNKMLRHPVRRKYMTKGLAFMKMIIWNAFHPFRKHLLLTQDEVKQRLSLS